MKKLLFLFVSCLFFLSCSNDDTPEATQEPMEFEVLFQSALTGDEITPSPYVYVVTTLEELHEMNNLFIEGVHSTDIFSENDFNNYYLLYVLDEYKPDSSYFIEVNSVYENVNSVDVSITSDSTDGFAFHQPMQPFTIVRIPKSNKSINFNFN